MQLINYLGSAPAWGGGSSGADIYQTGNPMSGGWRFPYGGGQTSTDALNYKPMGIDPEFLRQVAGVGRVEEKPRGLLDEQLTAKPLEGLLQGSPWDGGHEADGRDGKTSGTTGIGIGNMTDSINQAGINAAMEGGKRGLGGGLIGAALSAAGSYASTVNSQTADALSKVNADPDPIQALNAMQGWTGMTDYGNSAAATGAPSAAQAAAIAEAFARDFAAYDVTDGGGGLLGDSNLGRSGDGGFWS